MNEGVLADFFEKLEKLVINRYKISEEFWPPTIRNKYRVIWLLDRERKVPDIDAQPILTYDTVCYFERLGVTKDGLIIYGFDAVGGFGQLMTAKDSPRKRQGIIENWKRSAFHSLSSEDKYKTLTFKQFKKDYKKIGLSTIPHWADVGQIPLDEYLLILVDEITAQQILTVRNIELRRLLIKRLGWERLKSDLNAQVIHKDDQKGSELIRIEMRDPDAVDFRDRLIYLQYLKVKDSSTDREYVLAVEPFVRTCKEAVAWTFGLTERRYDPIVET